MKSLNNLASFILSHTKKFETKPAFILKDPLDGFRRPVSFKEFNDSVLKISAIFRKKYPKGSFKVGLWGENRLEWCAVALATWHSGGTLVPLMHIATDSEITKIIDRAKLDLLFISPKLGKHGNFGVREMYSLDYKTSKDSRNLNTLGDVLQQTAVLNLPKFDDVFNKPDDVAVLIFTSGTTGNPKGVMLTHKNIITNISDVIDIVPGDGHDRIVSVLPLSHMFELVGGFTVVHMKGICISYPESLKPEDIVSELKAHKATMMAAVPLFFEILDRTINDKIKKLPGLTQNILSVLRSVVLRYPRLGKIFFKKIHDAFGGHIKYFMSGGAKIDPDIIQRFKGVGIQMFQGYGLTETSPVISFTSPGKDKYGSVGKVIDSLSVKIFEPIHGEGEICVKGPNVFKGYFEDAEATASVLKDGWFHTGDIGRLDEEGYLFITGRKKDIIVTPNGKNIYPEEVEFYLKESPHFTEVCVLGMDQGHGESVCAVLVTKLSEAEAWKEVERLSGKLSDYKKVQHLILTQQELPKTPTKKIKKHELKKMIESGALTQSVGLGPVKRTLLDLTQPVEAWVQERLQLITKRKEIWKEASLKHEIGIDSLTFMEMLSAVETQWGVIVADEDFEKLQTVSDLIAFCNKTKISVAAESPRLIFDYKSNNSAVFNFLRLFLNMVLVRPMLKIFFRLSARNSEELNQHKHFVLTPNHASHLDLLSVYASLPLNRLNRTYAVAADDYFFNHPLKALGVRILFNAVPFKRKARVEESFKICEEILKDGGSLVIFPEGTRSPNGSLSEFKPGVGRLLAEKEYPAIPVYINGAFRAYPKGALFPKPTKISVTFGRAQKYLNLKDEKNSYRVIAKDLEDHVRNLMTS